MTGRVYLSPPDITALDEQYLVDALRSGWVAPLGPSVDAFEREVAERVGVPHAVALSSGTAALHLALLGVGTGPGDLVLVPTLTFAATANAVVYTGAEPLFVDCEPRTGNIDVDLLAELLAGLAAGPDGRRVRAVVPVDMFGRCVDYDRLLPLCAGYGVPVVEDAAEALGSTYLGRAAGSFGRAAALSFNGNKVITTSGGGMLLSADPALADRARYLACQARQPVAHYEHTDVGYNYRLSNLLAALGRAQLRRLDEMIERRRRLRASYAELFAGVPGVSLLGHDRPDGPPRPPDGAGGGPQDRPGREGSPHSGQSAPPAGRDGANCWLTTIVVDPDRAGWHATELAGHLAARDVETRAVWKPMHLQPVFRGARCRLTGAAARLFATGLTLPSGSALGPEQLDRVFGAVGEFLAARR